VSRTLHLALLACGLQVGPLLGGELIKPTLDVKDMRAVVFYVSTGKLANLQAKYGTKPDRRELRQDYRHGFSILRMNRETGAHTCEIYLPNAKRPAEVDDEPTLILGHEPGFRSKSVRSMSSISALCVMRRLRARSPAAETRSRAASEKCGSPRRSPFA
jgi:hypothetical protein